MLQINFHTSDERVEELSALLMEHGAVAVTLQDAADEPIYEPPVGCTPWWSHTRLIALFETPADVDHALEVMKATHAAGTFAYRVEPVPEQDWQRVCLEHFQPLRFGTKLWVCPSWHSPPDPHAVNLLLDPGLAFGTGTHPTTALCLEWLGDADLAGLDVIDYGCGSGILAVAAAKLGARRVWAIDNDPQALTATRANARQNGVLDLLCIGAPDLATVLRADLIVANILAGPLIELAPYFAACVTHGGRVVLSGVLYEQAEQVSAAYQPCFDMAPAMRRADWARLEGRRK